MNTLRTLNNVIEKINADPAIPAEQKTEIVTKLDEIADPLRKDNWIYRLVVIFLGVSAVATVIGGIIIAIKSTGTAKLELPQGIVAIGAAAVGALAGLLAPSPRGGG